MVLMEPYLTLKTTVILTLILAASTHASAQDDFSINHSEQVKVSVVAQNRVMLQSPLRARARDLAASTADESLKWNDTQAAIRVLAQAADLLWTNDPERSKAWLMHAWEITGVVANEDANNATRKYRSNSPQARARAVVLAVAEKHDQSLASRLLAQLNEQTEQVKYDSRRGIFDDRTARSEQLLNISLALVESDPAMAAQLAEQSLVDGVSFQLQGLLLALRERDRAAADHVFDRALNRLVAGFTHPSEGLVLASYLFTPGRILGASDEHTTAMAIGTRLPVPQRTPAQDDPARARRFLTIIQRGLLSLPLPSMTANPSQSAQDFMMLSGSLEREYNLYAPDLWMPIQQHMTQIIPALLPSVDHRIPSSVREKLKTANAAGRDEREFNRLYVDGLEEAAEKEPDPAARKLAFVEAALATTPEDLERGRGLAARITEDGLREQVITLLVYRVALLSLDKGRLDEAVKLSAEVKPLQRAVIFITVAQREGAKCSNTVEMQFNRHCSRALDLLSEAEKVLERNSSANTVARARLGLVTALTPLNATRALESFNAAVPAINDDSSFNPEDASAPWLMTLDDSSDLLLPRPRGGYGLKDAVAPLARIDFDGTILAAARLSNPALRGTCMIEIARSILSQKSDK
jgi:hypothetical protein